MDYSGSQANKWKELTIKFGFCSFVHENETTPIQNIAP